MSSFNSKKGKFGSLPLWMETVVFSNSRVIYAVATAGVSFLASVVVAAGRGV
jgi:hypothetical protein